MSETIPPLTPEETYVIEDKGTEHPFTGKYWDFKEAGTYLCRRCGAPLYRSDDKFDSDCGWPSFDDAIPGAVHWALDADGVRTEITCAHCGGHLGHVFVGEQFTDKNTRHCVNSLSMQFIPERKMENPHEVATLGGGCFWCIEAVFQRLKWVFDVKSGYSGGKRAFPSYEQVSTGSTGHIEVVQLVFDPSIITYQQILEVFFTMHDPTTFNRQGNDEGEQYASVIFYHNEKQKQTAESVMATLHMDWLWEGREIVTQLRPFENFYIAEAYHQNYFNDHGRTSYCQLVIDPKVQKLRMKWKELLK